jgi:hypothetical protein
MPKVCHFYNLTRRLLEERIAILRQGETPTWTDIRHFFYECRNKYLKENPERLEVDTTSKDPYSDWQGIIKLWCMKQSEEFDILPELWWRLREKINIWPEARATCEGESGKFLIEKETRKRVSRDCSFILLCEKKTVSRELLEKLRGEGYKLNIVATGGHSPSDVQEIVVQIGEELGDDPNFYILILHDYDRDGVKILFNLRERYSGVIDVGVNRSFIQYMIKRGGFDLRLVEEKNLNKNYQGELREKMLESKDYDLEDFDYLQGKPIGKKRWEGKRIEIDAVHVEYGIQPFIDYIMKKIRKECRIWDLSRIGVTEHWLEEPENQYDIRLSKLKDKAESAYKKRLATTYRNSILNKVIRVLLEVPEELIELIRRHWNFTYNIEEYHTTWELPRSLSLFGLRIYELDKLKIDYADQMIKEWLPDYEDQLNEINTQITNYEGDVRDGAEDLESQAEALQETLENAKNEDEDLGPFEKELNNIYWGEEELEAIEDPDEADEIRKVIEALQERLEELEEASAD